MDLSSGANKMIMRPYSNAYRRQGIPASTLSNAFVWHVFYLCGSVIWHVIIYRHPNFNGGLTKSPLKLEQEWVKSNHVSNMGTGEL